MSPDLCNMYSEINLRELEDEMGYEWMVIQSEIFDMLMTLFYFLNQRKISKDYRM